MTELFEGKVALHIKPRGIGVAVVVKSDNMIYLIYVTIAHTRRGYNKPKYIIHNIIPNPYELSSMALLVGLHPYETREHKTLSGYA